MLDELFPPPFRIATPKSGERPLLVASPHSGRYYSEDFLAQSRLPLCDLRRSEDCLVDVLIGNAVRHGFHTMAAHYPRAWLDLNREPFELDPMLFGPDLPEFANTRSERVMAGLGTIARIVANGMAIYRSPPSLAEALERIERIHRPWHLSITHLLNALHLRHGWALLLDVHSMPSRAAMHLPDAGDPEMDFVLGDRFGQSADPRITSLAESLLTGRGYRVRRNVPYAGGYSIAHHAKPERGFHGLQIEINRALYLDERRFEPNEQFDATRDTLEALFEAFARLDLSSSLGAAAE